MADCDYQARFGEVYSVLATSRGELVKFYFAFFCLHRLLFCVLVFGLEGAPLAQLASMGVASLLFTLYLKVFRPLSASLDLCLVFLNSLFLALLYFFSIAFLFVRSLALRSVLGFVISGSIALVNLVNIVALVVVKLKECCCKKKKKKAQQPNKTIRARLRLDLLKR